MFIKSIISFILVHILTLGAPKTQVYVPPPFIKTTTTKNISATPVPKVGTTTASKAKQAKVIGKAPAKTEITTQVVPTPVVPPPPAPNFEEINTFARSATVNILCKTKGDELSPISGSGVVVTPDGLILTNAHIGQYFLLRDFIEKNYVECVIRTGSPAYPKYNAEIVYISPTWVANNKSLLKSTIQKGTGENDFAFLRITESIDGSKLPENFPYILMNIREVINKDEPVILVSYPAGFLGGLSILQDLSITSAVTTIKEIYTFNDNAVDLIAVPGTVVSQRGSSGGAVVDKYRTIIGVITTSSEGDTTSSRALNAITVAYINRSMQKELGITLAQFASSDILDFAKKFQTTNVPNLTKLITDELIKQ